MLEELNNKSANIENIAQKALENKELLSELAENLKSKKDTIRENSFNVLLFISEKHPEALYTKWDYFVDMFDSNNAF